MNVVIFVAVIATLSTFVCSDSSINSKVDDVVSIQQGEKMSKKSTSGELLNLNEDSQLNDNSERRKREHSQVIVGAYGGQNLKYSEQEFQQASAHIHTESKYDYVGQLSQAVIGHEGVHGLGYQNVGPANLHGGGSYHEHLHENVHGGYGHVNHPSYGGYQNVGPANLHGGDSYHEHLHENVHGGYGQVNHPSGGHYHEHEHGGYHQGGHGGYGHQGGHYSYHYSGHQNYH